VITDERWSVDEVLASAPDAAVASAARQLAHLDGWSMTGCDHEACWGRCHGSAGEPYAVTIDHVTRRWRCSCPSRKVPCKHAVALALLWSNGVLAVAARPPSAQQFIAGRPAATTASTPVPVEPTERIGAPSAASAERRRRVEAGLRDLDRWLVDRIRHGIGTGDLDKRSTWDHLSTRLVDAQCGALANRVKRLAQRANDGLATPQAITAELAMLHLVARGGSDLGALELRDAALAASTRTAIGFSMSKVEVMATGPITDEWLAVGASMAAEERVTIRRTWLFGRHSKLWAVVIDAAAYGMEFDVLWPIGTSVHADLHMVNAKVRLRALVGTRHSAPQHDPLPFNGAAPFTTSSPPTSSALTSSADANNEPWGTITSAMDRAGTMLADEPWLERVPFAVVARPVRFGDRWVLTDETGSLPLDAKQPPATLLTLSERQAVRVMCELSEGRLNPLAAHLENRTVLL
jgi:hypothetical protein